MSKLFKKWAKCEYGMNDGMCAYHNGCDCMAASDGDERCDANGMYWKYASEGYVLTLPEGERFLWKEVLDDVGPTLISISKEEFFDE